MKGIYSHFLEDTFHERMGLNWKEHVELSQMGSMEERGKGEGRRRRNFVELKLIYLSIRLSRKNWIR